MKRAVITGFGIVSSIGVGKQAFRSALAASMSGVGPISLFDTQASRCSVAAQVNLVPGESSRTELFLELAAKEALIDAGIDYPLPKARVFQGTAHGGLDLWEKGKLCKGLPQSLGRSLWNSIGDQIRVTTITNACVASTWAVGLALNAIRCGETKLAIIAGTEALSEFLFRGFESLRSLTPTRCKPFDKHRDGLVLGEGAAVLVVEELNEARRRGAPIRAELAGFGVGSDACHMTAPDSSGRGAATAFSRALADAGQVDRIDYINLHGTGTSHNDRMEINAIHRVLQADVSKIPIGGTKGATGHTSGAAGVMETVVCLTVFEDDLIPETVGHELTDSEFAGYDIVASGPRWQRCNTVVSLNSAFGGANAALVLRRLQ